MSLNRTRDWDECRKRLDYLFETAITGFGDNYNITKIWKEGDAVHAQYGWGKAPDSVVSHLKRRVLITCLFGDYSKDTNGGQMLGYGNLLMIARHLDRELFNRIMVELHRIADIPIPAVLTGGSPAATSDDNTGVPPASATTDEVIVNEIIAR